ASAATFIAHSVSGRVEVYSFPAVSTSFQLLTLHILARRRYDRRHLVGNEFFMPFRPASSALSRFTVLDLTRGRAGPTCVRQLADWGANVIKVEEPAALQVGDAPGGDRHGADFQNLHRNKRSIAINLKKPAGRAVLLRLVRKADVVVENYRPDVKHRL